MELDMTELDVTSPRFFFPDVLFDGVDVAGRRGGEIAVVGARADCKSPLAIRCCTTACPRTSISLGTLCTARGDSCGTGDVDVNDIGTVIIP